MSNRTTVVAIALVLSAQTIAFHALPAAIEPPQVSRLESLPEMLGQWRFTADVPISAQETAILRPDDYVFRAMRGPEGSATVFIGYFRTPGGGHMPHSPQNCLPAHGWIPVQSRVLSISQAAGAEVNWHHVQKGDEHQVVVYWYQTPHRVSAREWKARTYLFIDAFSRLRTDTALVRIARSVESGNIDRETNLALGLASVLMPAIGAHLQGQK